MRFSKIVFCFVLCFTMLTGSVFATEEAPAELNWIEGGTTVQVGNLSSLKLDQSMLYLNEKDTATAQQYMGNTVYGTEIGSVFPADEEQEWFVLFEYEEVGHVSDKEKSKINGKKLLKSYQEGTEEANKTRPEDQHLFVKGWHTEPFYNEEDSTLIWALLAEDYKGNPLINYNVRILTRQGYISVLLVTDPAHLDNDIKTLNSLILANYTINEGSQYDDFNAETDKKSEVGLTGLILGGAGLVAAKKAGLLAIAAVALKKFWFILFAIPVAIWRWIKRRRNNEAEEQSASAEQYTSNDPNQSSDQTINNDQR